MEQIYIVPHVKTILNKSNCIDANDYLLVLRVKIFAKLVVVMFVAKLCNNVL